MFAELKSPLIIAHRGSSAIAPENTIAAFRQAIDDGADGLEFDVQLAKDGVPVVFHDSTLYRMAKKKIRTSRLTSAELKNFDVGAWFNAKNLQNSHNKYAFETIPTLAEVLDFLKDFKGRIYVELKCRAQEALPLAEAVAETVRSSALLPNMVLKSFELEAVREMGALVPQICTAALFAPKIMLLLRRSDRLIEKAKEFGADELSLHYSLATQKLVEKAGSENMPVTIWTADNTIWVKRALETGIRAIITNNPAPLLARREELFSA